MNRSVNIYYLNEAKKEKKEVKQSFMDKVKDIYFSDHFGTAEFKQQLVSNLLNEMTVTK